MLALAPGLALGAFFNNLASQVPAERLRVRLRSRCSRCGQDAGLFQSLGIVSYLWRGGRCARCGARRSLRYPLLELLTGALFVACFVRFGVSGRAFVAAAFTAVLVVLAAIDFEKRILPNAIVLPASLAILVANCLVEPDRALEWFLAAAAASLALLALALVYRGALGMGDVKFAFLLGAGLGKAILLALLVGFVAAGLLAVAIMLQHGFAARKQTIPLGPFLALGAIVALIAVG
jgi:prepilin signal peptidase PulO-like enzyme (type II secretory pathway)